MRTKRINTFKTLRTVPGAEQAAQKRPFALYTFSDQCIKLTNFVTKSSPNIEYPYETIPSKPLNVIKFS